MREYSGLDENMAILREELEELKPLYTRYLQNEPVASRLAERLNLLEEAREKGVQAEKAVKEAEAVWKEAAAGYNEAAQSTGPGTVGQVLQAHGEIQSRLNKPGWSWRSNGSAIRDWLGFLTKEKRSYVN